MSKSFRILLNNQGQHTLEYAVLLILVMAGIIIAGPYTIRSWNANMKSWEDTVIDSYNDPLLEAPDVVNLPGCSCSWDVGDPNFDCGPVGGCAETDLADQCTCSPVGCGGSNPLAACLEGTFRCNCHPLCCSTPVDTGLCGAAGGCATGEMQKTFSCGCGPQQSACFADPACSFSCDTPITPPPNSSPCPDIGDSATGCLTQNRKNVLVDSCTGGCDHCEYTCDSPYFPVGTPSYSSCAQCLPGFVDPGNCSAGSCETPSLCPSGTCRSS